MIRTDNTIRGLSPRETCRCRMIALCNYLGASQIMSTSCVFILAIVPDVRGIELIHNGSFEVDGRGAAGIAQSDWDDGPGVGNDVGFTLADYDFLDHGHPSGSTGDLGGSGYEWPPELPLDYVGAVRPMRAGDFLGNRWGRANGSGWGGSATQIVDLSRFANQPYEFSAWLASHRGNTEYAVVSFEFFSQAGGTGAVLGSTVFDGNDQQSQFIVGSLNWDGLADASIPATQDNWTLYRARGTIPSLAKSAVVAIQGRLAPSGSSGGTFGYVDLVSMQVVPEPSSAILACFFGVVAVTWSMHRRTTIRRTLRTSASTG